MGTPVLRRYVGALLCAILVLEAFGVAPAAAAAAAPRDSPGESGTLQPIQVADQAAPLPPAPHAANAEAHARAAAEAEELMARETRGRKPVKGDDPRDPAVVKTQSGVWLLFFTDDANNLYQQRNPGSPLEPFWQSGNVIVNGPVTNPDVARLDAGETSTLGLVYQRTVSSLTNLWIRTTTTDGASWADAAQLTTETASVGWHRLIEVDGTVYLFWALNSGEVFYQTTTDFSSWTARAQLGRNVGPRVEFTYPYFDITKLANGTWLLAYMDCTPGAGDPCDFPTVRTTTSSDLLTWTAPVVHTSWLGERWPGHIAVLQEPSTGSVYLAYDRYQYPWGRYVRLRIGSADGTSWGSETLFGCDFGIGCNGSQDVQAINTYLFLDDGNPQHVLALWQMGTGAAGVPDPYPPQLFQADLTSGIYYRPLPPYRDPAISFGAGSLGDPYVNVATGNLTWQEEDYRLGGLGPLITLTRTYNAGDLRDGIFGFSWSFPYAMGLQENADGSVTIANFDGRRDYYAKDGSNYVAPAGTETVLTQAGQNWTLAYRDHTSKTFDSNGRLIGITDVDGNQTALAYTAGRLSTITDAAGRQVGLTYNGNGRVQSISLPLSRTLQYAYDANGNLTSFTDAAGAVTTYAYASEHRLASVTDATGRATTFAWATLRRIKSRTDPLGAVTSYAYAAEGANGGTTTVTDPRGTQTVHTFDNRHRQTQIQVNMPGGGASNLVTTFAYNTDDQVISETNPRGTVTTFEYDARGNITRRVQDAGSGRLNLTWQYTYLNDNLTQSIDPRGAVTDYTYDAENHLLTKTLHLAGGVDRVWSYTYHPNGLIHTTKDPKGQSTGNATTVTYDSYGYPDLTTDPQGGVENLDHDAGGRMTQRRDKRNKLWTYAYDAADRRTLETDPLANQTAFTYSATGEQTSLTDGRGVVTTAVYQRDGEVAVTSRDAGSAGFRITNPGWELGTNGWSLSGSPTVVTSPVLTGSKAARVDAANRFQREVPVVAGRDYGVTAYALATGAGQTARLAWEWRRADRTVITSGAVEVAVSTSGYVPLRLAPAAAPAASAFLYLAVGSTAAGAWVVFDDVVPTFSTVVDFDGAGTRTAVLDANGHVTRFAYDAAGRMTSSTDARGQTSAFVNDHNGNVTRSTDPSGDITDYVYDALDRQTRRTVDPSGLALAWQTTYDAVGNVASQTDPDNRTTTFAYDRADRLVSVTDAASGVTQYAYDANGNRTGVTDANDRTRSAAYDGLNRLTESRDGLNRLTSYAYDPNGNRTSRTDAKGVVTTYVYDDANRMTSLSYSSGGSVSYVYDAAGRLTSMTDAHGQTVWGYDDLKRVTSVTQPSVGAVTYAYDLTSNRTQLVFGGKTTTLTYNPTDQVASVTDWAGRQVTYTHDSGGRLATVTYPTTVAATFGYDRGDRITSLAYTRGGSAFVSFAYTYNGSGQRLTEAGPEGTTTYGYDALHRLISAAYPSSASESFTYDPTGNRLSRVRGSTTTSYTYDAADQLLSETVGNKTNTFSYDANGNRASRKVGTKTTTYTYDPENRLRTVAEGRTTLGEYFYDGAGNRYAKRVGSTTTTYTLDLASELAQVLAESDGTAYLFGHDLLAFERSGAAHWYVPDALGSTRRVTDASGTVENTYTYEAFGATATSTGTLGNVVGFTGERADAETNLVFLRARHYDPIVGRFLQPDVWGYDERLPADINRYVYVRNDPVNAVDPSGHFLETVFDVVMVAVSVVEVIKDPSPENWAFLGADVGAMFIPFVPAGAGIVGRAARAAVTHGDNVVDAAAAAGKGNRASDTVRSADIPRVDTPQTGRAARDPNRTGQDAYDPRPKLRKGPREEAFDTMPRGPDGGRQCPTCGRPVTGRGADGTRDYDVDHVPPWRDRKAAAAPTATRGDAIADYNRGLRGQCAPCNRSGRFEIRARTE